VFEIADKKTVAILALISLSAVMGIGWLNTALGPPEKIPYDNAYKWTEYFQGYEAYLDQRIYPATMQTTSMVPTINVGDTLLWVKVDNMAELKVGDIIIYKHPTLPGIDNVAHRIVEILPFDGGYRFRTKGDNLSEPDLNLVPEGNVHGLVIGVIYSATTG
jgi:hypothetical protein